MSKQSRKSVNSTNFSENEIYEYNQKLSERYGAKQKVITSSGLSAQSYYRAMRGEYISVRTKNTIVGAIQKVVKNFN